MFVEGASYGCQRRVPTKGANEGCQRRVPTKGALDACTSSCFRLRIVVGSTGSISQLGPLSGHTGEQAALTKLCGAEWVGGHTVARGNTRALRCFTTLIGAVRDDPRYRRASWFGKCRPEQESMAARRLD